MGPSNFEDIVKAKAKNGVESKFWEWCSGSSTLSARARTREISHLPPIDYRYGWNMSRPEQQKTLMSGLIAARVTTLFVAPNCAPWGSQTRSMPAETLAAKRDEETIFLTFLCAACFVQVLLGCNYIIENSGYSDIFEKSPLAGLRSLKFFMALLDQCMVGGQLEGQAIRKRTHFQSFKALNRVHITCDRSHKHLNLRGCGRAACSAQYPQEECDRILDDCSTRFRELRKGGETILQHYPKLALKTS